MIDENVIPEPPEVMNRDQFIDYLAKRGMVPKLIEDLASYNEPPKPNEFRVVRSGLHPPTSEAWVFKDGLCMVCPALFNLLKQAMDESNGVT